MATVVFSVDAELGWGFHDQSSLPLDRITNARDGWRFLLDAFDRHGLPATWAVVGHLLLDECDRTHRDIPAPLGWFASERTGPLAARELRCAPELVGETLDATVAHDVGLHTFSHVQFGAPGTTHALARAELDAAVDVARSAGIEPRSFVFPRNDVGHRDVLADSPITTYRGVRPDTSGSVRDAMRKLRGAVLDRGSPPVVEPTLDETGLVNVPASLYLYCFEGLPATLASTVREDPVVAAVRRGLDAASEKSDGVLHLWLHPNNLVTERDRTRFERVCELVAAYRDRGAVDVTTMQAVGERTRDDVPASRVTAPSVDAPHVQNQSRRSGTTD